MKAFLFLFLSSSSFFHFFWDKNEANGNSIQSKKKKNHQKLIDKQSPQKLRLFCCPRCFPLIHCYYFFSSLLLYFLIVWYIYLIMKIFIPSSLFCSSISLTNLGLKKSENDRQKKRREFYLCQYRKLLVIFFLVFILRPLITVIIE